MSALRINRKAVQTAIGQPFQSQDADSFANLCNVTLIRCLAAESPLARNRRRWLVEHRGAWMLFGQGDDRICQKTRWRSSVRSPRKRLRGLALFTADAQKCARGLPSLTLA